MNLREKNMEQSDKPEEEVIQIYDTDSEDSPSKGRNYILNYNTFLGYVLKYNIYQVRFLNIKY